MAEATIETEESIVLRSGRGQRTTMMWCLACRRQVQMVTPEQAAQVLGESARTIYRWVEAGKIHFAEPREGLLLICRDSLSML